MKTSRLEVWPVYIHLYIIKINRPFIGFYGKIGPQFNFLTSAKVKIGNGDLIKNKKDYESVTLGGVIQAGTQFRLNDNLFLQTGIYFDYDFTNAEDKNSSAYVNGRAKTHNMNAGVQIGLNYYL